MLEFESPKPFSFTLNERVRPTLGGNRASKGGETVKILFPEQTGRSGFAASTFVSVSMRGALVSQRTPQNQKRRCIWQAKADYAKAFCVQMKPKHRNSATDRNRSIWNSKR